mgnify:CR=1 FL=1
MVTLDELLHYYPDYNTAKLILETSCEKVDEYIKDSRFFHKYVGVLDYLFPCIKDVKSFAENLSKEIYLGNKLEAWKIAISAYKSGLLNEEFIKEHENSLSLILTTPQGWLLVLDVSELVRDKIEENKDKLFNLLSADEKLWEVVYKLGVTVPSTIFDLPYIRSGLIKSRYFWEYLARHKGKKEIILNALSKGNLTAWEFVPRFLGVISLSDIYSRLHSLKLNSKRAWYVASKIVDVIGKDFILEHIDKFFERYFDGKVFVRLLKKGVLTPDYRQYYLELLMTYPKAWDYVTYAIKYGFVSKEEVDILREYFEYFVKVFKLKEKRIREELGWN